MAWRMKLCPGWDSTFLVTLLVCAPRTAEWRVKGEFEGTRHVLPHLYQTEITRPDTAALLSCLFRGERMTPASEQQELQINISVQIPTALNVPDITTKFHRISMVCNCCKLTPRSSVLLVQLTVAQLVKKFFNFYGTRTFITAIKTVRHCALS